MKKLAAVLLALLTALSVFALAEGDDGGEGVIHFPDAAQADSFVSDGDPADVDPYIPETLEKGIIGKDDRVTVKKPKQYPYSAIALLETKYECGCGYFGATGFMVTEDTLLTAAHCIVCTQHGKWAKKITFYFGYKSKKNSLYKYKPKWQAWVGTTFPGGTYSSEDDWAIINLNRKIGDKTGWFGMRWCSNDELMGHSFCMAGFGGEPKLSYAWGEITNVWDKQIGFNNDTLPGNSGSPIFDDGYYAVGIATSGSDTENYGQRLRDDIRQVMVKNGLL
ncbi:MAG: trypsin-like serine protease [Clostridia bacterium]|nr:trypsin-like serine protease [Clostridia bacterium]